MLKDLQGTFKEWIPAVPGRWYKILLHVIVPIIPFVTGLILAIERSTKGLPVPTWVWAMIIVSAVVFVVVSFYAFHRVRLERAKIISGKSRRQELKEWRKGFSNRTAIPVLLLDMYEIAKELCRNNRKPLTEEYWGDIASSFFGAHQAPTIVPSVDKMASRQEIIDMIDSTPDPLNPGSASTVENLKKLILNLQATMSLHNMGAIPLTDASVLYQVKHTALQWLQQNLPNTINTKINDCMLLSNGLASLLCVDFATTETPVSDELLIAIQYIVPYMDNWTQGMRDEISSMIENFLLGE